MSEHNMGHIKYLEAVAMSDASLVRAKEATYMGSWKRAGGRSAWFMFRRNMDRLIQMLAPPKDEIQFSLMDLNDVIEQSEESAMEKGGDCTVDFSVMKYLRDSFIAEDIFLQIESDPNSGSDGTVLACLRDLRCYALLIEAEMINRGVLRVPEIEYEEPETDVYGLIARETGRTRKEVKDMIHDLFYKPKTPEGMTRARTTDPFPENHKNSFDVGNGKFTEGEYAKWKSTFPSYMGLDICVEIIEILQDGEVSIDCGDLGYKVVKWRELSKMPETNRPGTPENGGQHESQTPWLVHRDYFTEQKISLELSCKFWRQLGASKTWILEPFVQSSAMPRVLRSCFDMRGDSWVIRMDRVPAELREYFPSLQYECNMKEWEDLPSYQKPLYTWVESENKYRLSEQNAAWRREQ